jgi:putative proteasome-type protease
MASDSRTNAGFDDLNVARKMHTFIQPDERVFVILSSGSLSLSQSVMNLLRASFDAGEGLAQAKSMYEAAREVGEAVRQISDLDRAALERDSYNFNVHLLLGGQVRGEAPRSFLIYPQGNPLSSTEDSPFLQLGEYKYGRPILDRGIVYNATSLKSAAKYALLSFDFQLDCYRRLQAGDRELETIHALWERYLRNAVEDLPDLSFGPHRAHENHPALL